VGDRARSKRISFAAVLFVSIVVLVGTMMLLSRSSASRAAPLPDNFAPVSYILDDFDDAQAPNDFFGDQGRWESGGAVVTDTFTCAVRRGSNGYALQLDYDVSTPSSKGGYWEHFTYYYPNPDNPIYDLSEYDEFHLWVKGDEGVGYTTRFYVEFVEDQKWNDSDKAIVEVTDIISDWQKVTVDLRTLTNVNWTQMRQVAIRFDNGHVTRNQGRLYFDDLHFVDLDGGYATDDQFLELVSRRAFKYFQDSIHPTTGLIKDRASNREASSIASVGFGLTAMGIGAERGWISRTMATSQVRSTLQTLSTCVQGPAITGTCGYKGFFYHLLDMETGQRLPSSELSSVDTALLMAGVLFAGEYFDDPADPVEADIRALADGIYRRVEWDWMLDLATNQFYMEWKPENPGDGFAGHWDHYTDETILICLLAIGSPTHSVPSDVFYAWERERGCYDDYCLIQTYWGSLFTYFFAHCWFDLRCLTDYHPITPTNWWNNSTAAALANRQFCIDNSITYSTYSANSWGLTACFGPGGYNGGQSKSYGARPLKDPPPNHDGTIAPYGAGSCIVFNPALSLSVLKNYYENYPKLWGVYGFRDAYNLVGTTTPCNPADDWYAHEYVGIDAGPMLLMIENYRSKFVWKTFMFNSYAQKAKTAVFYYDCPIYLPTIMKGSEPL